MRILWVLLALFLAPAGCKSKAADAPPPEATPETKGESAKAPEEKPLPALVLPEVPSDAKAPLPLTDKIKKGTLKNGMTYFIRQNARPENRGEFWLVVNAGSLQEDDDQRGLAHFLEHMAFNGTKKFPKNDLVERLQKLGVKFGPHINASTSFDETVYNLRVPTDSAETVDLTLDILAEWASAITLLESDVNAERGVILAEKRTRDGPELRLLEAVIKEVFAGTRYPDRLPIGTPEVLKSAPPETLRRFYTDWYHPANMAVVAVGDFDPAEIEKKLSQRFSTLTPVPTPKAPPKRVLPDRKKMLFLPLSDKELPISAVAVARVTPPRSQKSVADFRPYLVDAVMASMLNKRLEEAKRTREVHYLFAAGGPSPLVRAGEGLFFFAAAPPEKMQGSLRDLLDEVERARRHGFTASELNRALSEIMTNLEGKVREEQGGKRPHDELADELKRNFLTGEAVPGVDMELALVRHHAETLTPAECARVLTGFMEAPDLIVAAVSPKAEALISETSAMAEFEAVKKRTLEPYADAKSDQPLMAVPPTSGTIATQKTHEALGMEEWILSNGARVFLKPTTFKEDEILLAAGSNGGLSLASEKTLYQAAGLASSIPDGGLGEFDAITLSKMMAGSDASVSVAFDNHTESLSGSSNKKDLEVMLQLLHLRFTAPRKDPNAFRVWRERTRESLKLAENKPDVRFGKQLQVLRTNKNPRAVPLTEALAAAIDLDASYALYRDRIQDASDFTFALAGSFDTETAKPLILRYIGSLPATRRKETYSVDKWPLHSKKERLEVRDGTEPRANLSFQYTQDLSPMPVTLKDRETWRLFGEALMLNLRETFREELGETYGVSVRSSTQEKHRYATLTVQFFAAPKSAKALEKRALAEIAKAHETGPGADFIDKAKKGRLKTMETSLEKNGYWTRSLVRLALDDEPLETVIEAGRVVESITAKDVQAVGKRFFDPKRPIIGIHLPKK